MNRNRVAGGFSGCSGGKGARLVSSQVKNDESTCRGPYSRIANCGIASALALRVSGSGFMGLALYTGSSVARQRHVDVDRSDFMTCSLLHRKEQACEHCTEVAAHCNQQHRGWIWYGHDGNGCNAVPAQHSAAGSLSNVPTEQFTWEVTSESTLAHHRYRPC